MTCDICQVYTRDDNVELLRTRHWVVNMKQDQEYLGSVYVGLLAHKPQLSDLNREEWIDFQKVVATLESAVQTTFAPTHFNWQCLMNNAVRDGQETHVHWHMTPRYKAPVQFNNLIFTDQRWPLTCRPTDPNLVEVAVLHAIRDELQKAIK